MSSKRPKRKPSSRDDDSDYIDKSNEEDNFDEDYIERDKIPKKKKALYFENAYEYLDISSWPILNNPDSDDRLNLTPHNEKKENDISESQPSQSSSIKLTLKTNKRKNNDPNATVITMAQFDRLLQMDNDIEFLKEFNYPIPELLNREVSLNSVQKQKEEIEYDWEQRKWEEGTYINCDLRYFNLDSLGKFDVVLIDPPWRLRGGQNVSDEKTMFTNNKFSLNYNTLSNEEIVDIDIGIISDNGFIFLWTINSQMEVAFECLEKWGYSYIDRIVWIKKTINQNIAVSQGYYLLHSSEICLVGIKKTEKNTIDHIPKVSNDLIFSEVKKQSQKPNEIYEIIERMAPGARKIELFGRNHNIRKGWLTLGNQVGEKFHWTSKPAVCFNCKQVIEVGNKRFKHKDIPKKDLCKNCSESIQEDLTEYFVLDNDQEEIHFHEFYKCNVCNFKPIWGLRFSCITCSDLNLCEECYDKKAIPEGMEYTHTKIHKFDCIEMPLLAGGLPIHKHKCSGCETFPIVGYRFSCKICPRLSLCQKCFFLRKEPKSHCSNTHEFELFTDPQFFEETNLKCAICQFSPIDGLRYKCNGCYDFELCKNCYVQKKLPPMNHVSHKSYHTFTIIDGFEIYSEAEFKDRQKKK